MRKRAMKMIFHSRTAERFLKVVLAVLLALAVTLLPACTRAAESGVIIAGSTSVQPFAEVLAEEYMAQHSGINIDVQGGGSSAGVRAAQSGTADIGMSSRALKGEEKELWWVEIARDGLAVIVHPSNPVNDLTLAQVRDIYAAAVTDWSAVGGVKSRIHVFTREEGSGTRDAFSSLVMGSIDITARAMVQDSNGAVRQLVADDPAAIGFISLGLVNDKVKALTLGGVAATHDNVINGTYSLTRPFIFLAASEPAGEAKRFIDFTLSEEGKKRLEAEGLVTAGSGN